MNIGVPPARNYQVWLTNDKSITVQVPGAALFSCYAFLD